MKRFGIVSSLVAATIGTVISAVPATTHAESSGGDDPAVISAWIDIAARTIYPENATPVPASGLYFGFVSLAVYDAVVTIEGGFEPVHAQTGDGAEASSQLAAATAAYQVLLHFFPASADLLAADYAAALEAVPDGPAQDAGVSVGEAAATAVIASRDGDGRGAPRLQPGGTEPGVWRPTPPDNAFMVAPWLGFVTPLLLESPTQFTLPGPDAITSEAYAADFAEVMQMGAKEGSQRTEEQTATAMFWTPNAIRKYQLALAARTAEAGFDIAETARAFAILNASTADALVACWRAKYDFNYWRPVTAIRLADTDGNDATEPDPEWEPLIPSPPYADYTSGHACVTGAASETASHLFGADTIALDVPSLSDAPARHFDTAAALDEETNNARIWLGIHFRKAMTDGCQLGHDVAGYAIATYFQRLA